MFVLRGSLLVLLVVSLAAFVGCANPADNKTEAQVSEPVEGSAASGGGEELSLGPDSKINFIGSKVTGSHNGGFNEFDGTVYLVDGDPAASRVEVTIDTSSLWADNERLTGHLKSADFFDVAKFPQSSFESTSIEKTPEGYDITGNLDLHGVRKSITFPAEIVVTEGEVRATADFYIKRFDFGIEYKGKADDLIRDEVVIQLDLAAPRG